MTRYHEKSLLLELLAARKAWNLPPYRHPRYDIGTIRTTAQAYAQAYDSDPFAYSRAKLYLSQGYELPSDMRKDAKALQARREVRS